MRLNKKMLKHFLLLLVVSLTTASSLFAFDAANLDQPANNAICQSISTEFSWNVNNPDRVMSYVIQVSAAQDFSTFVANETVDTNAVFVDMPNFSSEYFWRVVTTYDDFTTEYSEERTFTTETEPVMLTAPENNTSCLPQNVEFEWTKADITDTYEIWISSTPDFTDTIHYEEIDTNFYVGYLENFLQDYYWKVRREFQNCKSEWSNPFHVTTAAEKPKTVFPELAAPNIDPASIELVWKSNVGFENYEVWIANNPDFTEPGMFLTSDTSLIVTDLQFGTEYFWKVKGDTNSCWSDFSNTSRFWTTYPAPVTVSPEDSATCVEIEALFDWDSIPHASGYQLQIAYINDFNNFIYKDITVLDSTHIVVALDKSNADYFWRVRANDLLNVGLWSDVRMFTSSQLEPGITFPSNDMTGLSKNITFEWNYATTVSNFRFQITKDSTFVDSLLIADTLIGNNTSFHLTLDTFNTNYFWRVKAIHGDCEGEWTEIHKFRTSIGAPVLTTPANGATDIVQNILFRWNEVPLADTYTILLATDSLFENEVIEVRDIPVNNVQPTILEPSTTYWWKVYARNEEGAGPWSQAFSFTTIIAGPAQPMLATPSHNDTKLPVDLTFAWFTTEGANSYELQVADRDSFVNLFAELTDLTDTTATITGLKNNTHYFWRVRALNDSGYSKWSDTYRFRTIMKAPVGDVALYTPADGAIDQLTDITLNWSKIENALYYHVQFAKDDQFNTMVYEKETYWDTTLVMTDLDYSTKYFWRIRAYNEAGETTWSSTYSFTTESETSVADNQEFGGEVSLYPNPAQTTATLSFDLAELSNVAIQVYDVNGSSVISIPAKAMQAGTQNVTLDVNNLFPGVYSYTIIANEKVINGRFVVYR